MSGSTNLQQVLNNLQISCDNIEYGFASISDKTKVPTDEVLGTFQEIEGLTIIARVQYLKRTGLSFEGPFAKLTIDATTSLDLVGLTAFLATKLAERSISANFVAGYFHDHVFIQYGSRNKAIEILNSSKESS